MLAGDRSRRCCFVVPLLALLLCGCTSIGDKLTALSQQRKIAKVQAAGLRANERNHQFAKKVKNPAKLKLSYAYWMERAGKLPDARVHYSEILKEDGECVEALLGLARIEHKTGQAQQAEELIRKALTLEPDSAEAHHTLSQFYAGQRRWPEAIEELNLACASGPETALYQYDLAIALARHGETHKALPLFQQTVGEATAHYNVGMILKDDGQLAQAEHEFQTALRLDPNLEQAQAAVGELRRLRRCETQVAAIPAAAGISIEPAELMESVAPQPARESAVHPASYESESPVIMPQAGHSVVEVEPPATSTQAGQLPPRSPYDL